MKICEERHEKIFFYPKTKKMFAISQKKIKRNWKKERKKERKI